MRRPRAAVGVWPAFADLMAVFAAVALLASLLLFVNVQSERDARRQADLRQQTAERSVRQLREELVIADLRWRDAEAELNKARGIDAPPCLGHRGKSLEPLLIVRSGTHYDVSPAWAPEHAEQIKAIPAVSEAVSKGRMDLATFTGMAAAIYQYGTDPSNAFGRSCRFYVELKRGESSLPEFASAYALVTRYFFIANPAEVNRSLALPE